MCRNFSARVYSNLFLFFLGSFCVEHVEPKSILVRFGLRQEFVRFETEPGSAELYL